MTKAAEELHLSRSAISHQLKALESLLGFSLTSKKGRNVELTASARLYLRDATDALDVLAGASVVKTVSSLAGVLNVSCVSGLAVSCLCPNIFDFQKHHPDLKIDVSIPSEISDVSRKDIDVFIAYGEGYWPGFDSTLLASIELTPVCSPTLVNLGGGIRSIEDLVRYPLISLSGSHSWARWFSAARYTGGYQFGLSCSDLNLIQSAVLAGQGVALGDTLTSATSLARGALIRPFALHVKSAKSYYLLTRHEKSGQPEVEAFRSWMLAVIKQHATQGALNQVPSGAR